MLGGFCEARNRNNLALLTKHALIQSFITQGPEEMCLSLEHQNPSKTSEKMGYFDRVDDGVTVSLHILYTATEGSQDRLLLGTSCLGRLSDDVPCASEAMACGY